MSRAARLLDLIQLLRQHRYPVSGEALARELGVSLRTIYRDVASLQAQGADIAGEPGVGYLLRPGFMLPPLMFTEEELEALVLGARWVAQGGDRELAAAARAALAKVGAVLPADLRQELEGSTLLVPSRPQEPVADEVLVGLRQAIRQERKVVLDYRDAAGAATRRTIWPFALGFFERTRVVAAWCEARQAFRHFRGDRIAALDVTGERYPRRRHALLAEWRASEGIQGTADKI